MDMANNSAVAVIKELPVINKEEFRENILALENAMAKIPGALFGDNDKMPLKHSFADGVYVREIFLPKGYILTGKIHRHSHPNFLMKGEVLVVTENGGKEHLKAPLSMISMAGTKRAIYAIEDTTWITVHVTNETDLGKIEDYVIAKTYDDPALLARQLAEKNCLILALKEKGRDFNCLLGLKSDGTLLPFKESIEKLKENNIPLDGLFTSKNGSGEWHVTTVGDAPLADAVPAPLEMVGTWAAVAVGGGTAAATYLASTQGGGSTTTTQVPLETAEQKAARQLLQNFAQTGTYGKFTAGADAGVQMGDYSMTGMEKTGQSQLEQLLSSGIPEQYKLGDTALASLLNTDPSAIAAQFDPFKAQVQRQITESNTALKRGAGFAGNLYSTNTVRGLGDIQARGNETLTSQLASLTNDALNRKLQAIPLAYESGAAQENLNQGRIASAYTYGGLSRALSNAGTEAANAETLRKRNELLIPIDAAKSVAGSSTNYGVPSVTTQDDNQWLNLLSSIVGAGAKYYGATSGGSSGGKAGSNQTQWGNV